MLKVKMIEKLKKLESPDKDQQVKYFKLNEEKKHSSSPLKLIDRNNNLSKYGEVHKRRQSVDVDNFKFDPYELSNNNILHDPSIENSKGNFANDEIKANDFIYKRAMENFNYSKPPGQCFEHSLAQLNYLDLMMKNAGKLYRLNTFYEWKK